MCLTPSQSREGRVPVEWHDCLWRPAITTRPRPVARRWTATKPLIQRLVLTHSTRRPNLFKLMKKNPSAARRFRAGFTLVELLVVIAIIGILAAMVMTGVSSAKKAALKMKARNEAIDLANAINAYDAEYGRFPITGAEQTAAGVNDFTTGYVQYPQATSTTLSWPPVGVGYAYDNNSNVISILMDLQNFPNGNLTANNNHVKNPKQVKFLAAKMSGYDPTSPIVNPPGGVDNTGVYRDPWGNPYIITMDTSYDDQSSDFVYSLQSVSQNPPLPVAYVQTGYNGLSNPNATAATQPQKDNFLFHGKVMVWSAGPDGKVNPLTAANLGDNKDNILSWQ